MNISFAVKSSLSEALQKRLYRVLENIPNIEIVENTDNIPTTEIPLTAEMEEALKVVMIRIVPELTKRQANLSQLLDFLKKIRLASCFSSDLRFLDAWNVVYENVQSGSEWVGFYVQYAEILETRLRFWGRL